MSSRARLDAPLDPRMAWLTPVLALLACGPDPAPTRPVGKPVNVVVITLDTTRADHLGCYGYGRVKTPNLDRLAAEGTLFERAFTPIPSTFPSHATLFTGRYPASHGVHDNAVYFLSDDATTLAELLHDKGYATGAFVSAFVLDHQFKLDQGFDVYDDRVDQPLMAVDVSQIPKSLPEDQRKWAAQVGTAYQRRADATTKPALEWLRNLGEKPFFLWVHYFDAHQPYQPPPPWDRAFDAAYKGPMNGDQRRFWPLYQRGQATQADRDHMVALYDGEISWLDQWIGTLLDGIRSVGRMDETLVVVVADHGEGLGEHVQLFEHNSEIYDEVVHVPLIVWRPDGPGRHAPGQGAKIDALVRTLDVAPTILDWLGMAPDPALQGLSLLPFTAGDPAQRAAVEGPEEILLEALRERQINQVDHSFLGLRGADWKLILTLDPQGEVKRTELYELATDPGEKRSVADAQSERATKLREKCLALHRQLPRPDGANARELGELDSAALRALGYAGK